MKKNVHDIDELFRSALENYEESPSPLAKESFNSALNKMAAESNKKSTRKWKYLSFVLLFMITGLLFFDTVTRNNRFFDGKAENIIGELGQATIDQITKTGKAVNEEDQRTTIASLPESGSGHVNKASIPEQGSIDKGNSWNRYFLKSTGTPSSTREQGNHDETVMNGNEINPYPHTSQLVSIGYGNTDPYPMDHLNSKRTARWPYTSMKYSTFPGNDLMIQQNGRQSSFFKPYWSMSPFVSYEMAGYFLDSDIPGSASEIEHREEHEASFAVGLLLNRQFRERWGIQSGLVFTNTVIGISSQNLYAFQNPNGEIAFKYITSSGYTFIKPDFGAPPSFGDSLVAVEGEHTIRTISVPVMIKYAVGSNRLSLSPGAGLEANFITSTKVETELEYSSSKETVFINELEGVKPFYLALAAEAEVNYKMNNKVSLSIRPRFRHAITSVTETNDVETFPRSFGVGVGLKIKF